MTECGETAGALELLKDASERFGEDGKYLLGDWSSVCPLVVIDIEYFE